MVTEVRGRKAKVVTKEDRERLAEIARSWASSREGQRQLQESPASALQTMKHLDEAPTDPEKLREPVSV